MHYLLFLLIRVKYHLHLIANFYKNLPNVKFRAFQLIYINRMRKTKIV